MMTDANITERWKDGRVCAWCGMHVQITTPQKSPVCQRCYNLLSSAGLKDEEIFSEVKPDENDPSPYA